MKKEILLLAGIFTLLFFSHLQAQVTIGTGTQPAQGAILQLKENENTGANATKGLVMPRVSLTVSNDLTDLIPSPVGNDKEEHIGLVVYNVNDLRYNFCHGLYVWDGEVWQPLSEQPPAPVQHTYGSVSDIEGNTYKTMTFGTAGTWMVENLRVLHNNLGAPLSNSPAARINPGLASGGSNSAVLVSSWAEINALPPVTYSENGIQINSTASDFVKKFGLMYMTNQRLNLCPAGWHIPSQAEWLALAQYFLPGTSVGANDNAQDYFRSGYTNYISADNIPATWQGFICNNSQMTGFNALPAGRVTNILSTNNALLFGQFADFAVSQDLMTFAVYNGGAVNNGIGFAIGNLWATPVRCKKD